MVAEPGQFQAKLMEGIFKLLGVPRDFKGTGNPKSLRKIWVHPLRSWGRGHPKDRGGRSGQRIMRRAIGVAVQAAEAENHFAGY